jgi:hypothetical protein
VYEEHLDNGTILVHLGFNLAIFPKDHALSYSIEDLLHYWKNKTLHYRFAIIDSFKSSEYTKNCTVVESNLMEINPPKLCRNVYYSESQSEAPIAIVATFRNCTISRKDRSKIS